MTVSQDIICGMQEAIAMEQARIAEEQGVSVPELLARAAHNLRVLRRRRGLVVLEGGQDDHR